MPNQELIFNAKIKYIFYILIFVSIKNMTAKKSD